MMKQRKTITDQVGKQKKTILEKFDTTVNKKEITVNFV
jgi:hypothetical protein